MLVCDGLQFGLGGGEGLGSDGSIGVKKVLDDLRDHAA